MVRIRNIGESNSIFNQFISEIRDREIQKDPLRFRKNIERVGEIFAYEISKELDYGNHTVQTPLGECEMKLPDSQIVLASVLRAGLPLHQGLLNFFDRAQNAFISAYRYHLTPEEFEIKVEYISGPSLENKVLILCDPMLATGQSMVLSLEAIVESYGMPAQTHVVSVISSQEGVAYLGESLDMDMTLWTGAIDTELTAQAYIVPGLGDAGDLAFGVKE